MRAGRFSQLLCLKAEKGKLRTKQVTEAKQLPDKFSLHQIIVKPMHLFLKCFWKLLLLRMAQVAWASSRHLPSVRRGCS